jgi:hypothetical protein
VQANKAGPLGEVTFRSILLIRRQFNKIFMLFSSMSQTSVGCRAHDALGIGTHISSLSTVIVFFEAERYRRVSADKGEDISC